MAENEADRDDLSPKVREEHRLRTIIDRMADGVVIVSEDGTIQFANRAAEDLFGRPASELLRRELGFPVVAGDTTEVEVVRPRLQTITAELRTVALEWEGAPAHLISLRDITDRKRAEERGAQLDRERVARIEAEAANEAKSEFLALMSHELRTPLNAVIGYSDLLELGVLGAMPPEQRQHITRIRTSARHLLGLVNEILDLARVEAGQLALQQGTGRANETADAAIALVQPTAESRGIQLRAFGSGADADDLTYGGDEDRVRQILVNLVNNAVKFTPHGGSVIIEWGQPNKPDPAARLSGRGPWLCFQVRDTGVGIPREKLNSIFEPFVQVESGHTRSKDGSGLGLTISRRLARLMKGDLTVQSEVGKGSTFTLWLPDASSAARDTARWHEDAPDVAARLNGLGDVGKLIIRELDHVLEDYVMRLRAEPLFQGADSLRFSQLADHLGAFIADVGTTLAAIEDSRGQLSSVVTDSSSIQSVVAERHGLHRARLGWTARAIQREWTMLCEGLIEAIRRHGRALPSSAVKEACLVIERVTQQASETSVRAHARSTNAGEAPLVREAVRRELRVQRPN